MHESEIFKFKDIMMSSFTVQSLLLVSLLLVVLAGEEDSSETAMFPAMFVFGDSLVDNGNNNHLNSLARSNYLPYGIDFAGNQPTGRFSNGKTIVDFIGTYSSASTVIWFWSQCMSKFRTRFIYFIFG